MRKILKKKTWQEMLGASIKKYRKRIFLTQREAANLYGCSLRWWQHLEAGRNISVKTLILIGKCLVVKPWLLLRG
jgi:hypothetical protein